MDAVGQEPVHDHGVHREAVEAEVHEGALRLLDDDLLRVRHEPHGRRLRVLEERVDAFELLRERLHVVEVPVRRERQVGHLPGDGPRDLEDRALEPEELLHVPLERRRKRDEPQRLPGGRAVEDEDVESLLARVLVHVEERRNLLHAREDRELLGEHLLDAGDREQRRDVPRDVLPVAADLLGDVDLLDPEVLARPRRASRERGP